ncbi:MAG: HAD family phosphatase, partial [Monoglobaceae bacterium]
KAIERLGVSADEAVVFDDAVSGIKSARAAKAGKTVGVLSIDNRKELEEAGADKIINNFYDILSIDELLS